MTQFSGAGDKKGMQQSLCFKLIIGAIAILLYLFVCMVIPRKVLSLMVIGNAQAEEILDVAVQNIQSNSRDGVNPYMPMYEHLAWQQLHEYVQPAPYRQFVITEGDIPNAIGRKGVGDAFLSGRGLEKFFVMGEDGVKPLFPDHEELKRELKTNRLSALSELHRRLGDAALGGNLAYCAPDPENAGQYKGFRMVEGRKGAFDVKALPAQKPEALPWYKRWFSIFFREDVAKHRRDTAAHECFEQMKPMYEEAASHIQPDEPEKKIPDPVKEARKAKLAKMTPEERFEYDLLKIYTTLIRASTMPASI